MRARVLSWAALFFYAGWGPLLIKATDSWLVLTVVVAINLVAAVGNLWLIWAVGRERPVAQADPSAWPGRGR
jgi:hypothetical protein